MYEVLARRFRQGAQGGGGAATCRRARAEASGEPSERDAAWDAPDLFVVDGGRGQLGVALAAAHDLGLHDLPIVGLAKERENAARRERSWTASTCPGRRTPSRSRARTTSLFLLARLRDEAHRFSNRARMRLGKKRRFRSPLDDVKGLGPPTKKALLRQRRQPRRDPRSRRRDPPRRPGRHGPPREGPAGGVRPHREGAPRRRHPERQRRTLQSPLGREQPTSHPANVRDRTPTQLTYAAARRAVFPGTS